MYVGFDIGGTSIKYGVLDETGVILEKSAIPTSYEPAQFYQDLLTIIEDAQSRHTIDGIGISAPGSFKRRVYVNGGRYQIVVW